MDKRGELLNSNCNWIPIRIWSCKNTLTLKLETAASQLGCRVNINSVLSLTRFFVRKQFSALGAILGVRRRLSEKNHFFLRKNSTPKKCPERFFLQKFRQFFLQKNPIHAQIDSFQPCFAPKQRLFFLRKIPPVFLRKITHFLAPSKLRRLSSDFDAIRAQTSMPAELRLRCHPSSDFGAMTSAPSELRLRRHPSSGFGAIRAQTSAPSELRLRRRPSLDFNAVRA